MAPTNNLASYMREGQFKSSFCLPSLSLSPSVSFAFPQDWTQHILSKNNQKLQLIVVLNFSSRGGKRGWAGEDLGCRMNPTSPHSPAKLL